MTLRVVTHLFGKSSKVPAFTPEYDRTWVEKLYNAWARHYRSAFSFVCLTDEVERVEQDGEIIYTPLHDSNEGWMNILECFRPDLAHDRNVWVALDTIICRDITALVNDSPRISAPRSWHKDYRHEPCNPLMLYDREAAEECWFRWSEDRDHWRSSCRIKERSEGPSEMRFFVEMVKDEPDFGFLADGTGEVVSYREELLKRPSLRDTARIVYFHGSSKPHKMPKEDPLWEHWC